MDGLSGYLCVMSSNSGIGQGKRLHQPHLLPQLQLAHQQLELHAYANITQ
jgi:hypothetical protein